MQWAEEFDLMIIILKTLSTKCCKKGVKNAVPDDNIGVKPVENRKTTQFNIIDQ
jgi:hypothetical protein